MSDQMNNQQGYPQGYGNQSYQQVNPQQNYQQVEQQQYYQQMNQQGYQQVNPQQNYQQVEQQYYQQMNQQGYQQMNQQGYQQNYQGYQQSNPGQGYQQPTGGPKPPKGGKPKTGLIVGIIVGAIALVAGIILLIFKDKIFGGDDKTTEATTEISLETTEDILTPDEPNPDVTTEASVDIEGGCDSPEDLITTFWTGFEYCDEDQINQCFYMENSQSVSDAEYNYNLALSMDESTQVHIDSITMTFEDMDEDEIGDIGVTVVAAKEYHAEVPLTQTMDGVVYEVNDIYDGTMFQLENDKWYLFSQKETDVEVVSQSGGTTEDAGNSGSSSAVDESMYLGYGDLKPMGDDICGYVDVPSDWEVFTEIGGVNSDYSYQMCSPDMQAIITMCAWDADLSAEDSATAIYDGLVEEGVATDIQGATVTIGDYEAYQVYCMYEDIYLVTYSFRAEDGRLHYVAAEFPEEYMTIVLNIEGTFRFTE